MWSVLFLSFRRPNLPTFETLVVFELVSSSWHQWPPFTPAALSFLPFFGFLCDTKELSNLCVSQFPLLKLTDNTRFLPTSQGCCEDKCVHGKRNNMKFKVFFLCCYHWTVIAVYPRVVLEFDKFVKNTFWSWVWSHMPVSPVLGRRRQKGSCLRPVLAV